MDVDVDAILADCTVTVRSGTFDIVQATTPNPDAFASLDDGDEITVVAKTGTYAPESALAVESGWRILTFDVVLPFELVGFLARVATELAAADVSIFALSAFSTDHVLVKDEDLDAATACLEGLGCTVTTRAT